MDHVTLIVLLVAAVLYTAALFFVLAVGTFVIVFVAGLLHRLLRWIG